MSKMKHMTVQDQVLLSIDNSIHFLRISSLDISPVQKDVLKAELRLSLVLGTNLQKQLEEEYLYTLCSYVISLYMQDPYKE